MSELFSKESAVYERQIFFQPSFGMQAVYKSLIKVVDDFHQAFLVSITVAFPCRCQPAGGQFAVGFYGQGRTQAVEVATVQCVGAFIQDWEFNRSSLAPFPMSMKLLIALNGSRDNRRARL